MRILFFTQIIPYPPDAGPKVKTWNVLRFLVESGHDVTLVSFVRRDEEAAVQAVSALCSRVYTVPLQRKRWLEPWYWLKSVWNRKPFLIERDDRKEFRKLVTSLVQENSYDILHADQINMAQFALLAKKLSNHPPALIFDAHNADWVILDRAVRKAKGLVRILLTREAQLMKRYEGSLVNSFDQTLAVSEIDQAYLEEAGTQEHAEGKPQVKTIPIAVDTYRLQPVQRKPGSMNIVTLGTLHYPPNAEGIRWFIQGVFPKIKAQLPEANLTIIGKNPPKDFVDLAKREPGTYQVTGYVPELTPWLEKAAILVVPVLVGGGMRVRILEAFAYAMPVITTSIGMEGIQAHAGIDVLVEDDPAAFAAVVVRVMKDAGLQASLSSHCRRLVERCYDWKVVLKELGDIYTSLEQARNGSTVPPQGLPTHNEEFLHA